MLSKKTASEKLEYPIIYLKDKDIEIAISHGTQYGEDYYSFVNGQYTTQGGTHLAAFKEAIVKVVRDFFKKDYEEPDYLASLQEETSRWENVDVSQLDLDWVTRLYQLIHLLQRLIYSITFIFLVTSLIPIFPSSSYRSNKFAPFSNGLDD